MESTVQSQSGGPTWGRGVAWFESRWYIMAENENMAFTAIINTEINVLPQQVEVDTVSNDYVLFRVEWLFERIDQLRAVTDGQIPEAAMRALKSIQEMLVQSGRPKIHIPIAGFIRYLELGVPVR